jgi:serine protease DegQ
VVAAALVLSGCTAGDDGGDAATAPAVTPTSAPAPAGSPALQDLPDLVRRLEPSVVTVLTQAGGGSGVVYREDGLVVTNEHVVRGNQRVQVAFADGQRVPGEVIATDALVDVALLRVDRDGLPVPDYRTELQEVGELAVVIGSPLGFQGTVTAGIISGLHRDIPGSATLGSQALVDLIQTDAPISPGNSGGALLDGQGRVVGLSEAYIPPSAGAVSLGFAIPAETVVRVADELLEDGRAQHAYLGVQFGRLTEQIAQELGAGREGALVLAVEPGGPAEAAGAQPGDVVVAVEGERVRTVEQVLTLLRQSSPGDRLTMTVLRAGRERDLDVRVGDRPAR